MQHPPPTSRAWTITARGLPPNVLQLVDRPTPTLPPHPLPADVPEPEEWILVRTAYAALNPGAIFQMTLLPQRFRKALFNVPEMDMSGVVVDVWHPDRPHAAEGATPVGPAAPPRFARGEGVCAMLPASHTLPTGTGALAEYVALPARYAVRKPPSVAYADAAALLAALTAHRMVVESGARAGDRVLVVGASGGIGTMAVQMLRHVVGKQGVVVGVCSGGNAEMVRALGADEIVDYMLYKDLSRHLAATYASAPFDAVLDTLGFQALYKASPAYLREGGVYESVGIKPPTFWIPDFLRAVWTMKLNEWWPTSRWLGGVGRKWGACSMMHPSLAEREAVVGLMERGVIRVVRDSVWDFEHAREAYDKLAGRHAAGKILVRVDASVGENAC
ncbi:zinc alcohol dehydrogenase [Cutaneotrichosporon oleaginosum]|uniref:Zinc alcohol dehydrogenase n=1 Tax=Cutaneotrichosporon oleaginosum TaxID=879819 RepID=A0A0J0XRK1_9TREE|nr:zinc alcohol dehydrogenase [Cutaneotrichosporon oleaginosum]KLT43718.1 zinc alcohol dehydrogenase [Cutaneotrichosporon oleaginosum]TXT05136.1 hypothetical protein COLE_06456 [Cutaneotrichosporon oleaginosum]